MHRVSAEGSAISVINIHHKGKFVDKEFRARVCAGVPGRPRRRYFRPLCLRAAGETGNVGRRPAECLKRAGAAAKKFLESIDLTARLSPIVHLSMRAMMIFGGAKKGTRVNASDRDRTSALMVAHAVTCTPIVKAAILDGWPHMQKMRVHSGYEQEFVGTRLPRLQ